MSLRDNVILLHHILEASGEIIGFITNRTRDDLASDRMLQHSLVRCLEIIGEAASKVTPEFQKQYPELPWKQMVATRNRLIHAYFTVNLEIVWQTCRDEIPVLNQAIERILDQKQLGDAP